MDPIKSQSPGSATNGLAFETLSVQCATFTMTDIDSGLHNNSHRPVTSWPRWRRYQQGFRPRAACSTCSRPGTGSSGFVLLPHQQLHRGSGCQLGFDDGLKLGVFRKLVFIQQFQPLAKEHKLLNIKGFQKISFNLAVSTIPQRTSIDNY